MGEGWHAAPPRHDHRAAPDDTDITPQLDAIAAAAATVCAASNAWVLGAAGRQPSVLGRAGAAIDWTAHPAWLDAVQDAPLVIVPDLRDAPGLRDHPLVTGAPDIHFYAGHRLVGADGASIGTLCVIDPAPRDGLGDRERVALAQLAGAAQAVLTVARAADAQRQQAADWQARFDLLAETMPQLVWSAGADGMGDYFSRHWCDFTGAPASASMGEGWLQFVHADDRAGTDAAWARAVDTGGRYEARYRLRRAEGEYRWVYARGSPMRDARGAITRWIGTCADIQGHVQPAEQLERLSWELSHRINNIFAVIGGMVTLTGRRNPDFAPLARELRDRVLALGRAHDAVRSRALGGDGLLPHNRLQSLLRTLLPIYASSADRIKIHGDDVVIDERAATPLGVFLHEMAVNSVKYGALSDAAGTIDVMITDGDPVTLRWVESGGPKVTPPEHQGFGQFLMTMSVSQQMGGTLNFEWASGGLIAIVTLPQTSLRRS